MKSIYIDWKCGMLKCMCAAYISNSKNSTQYHLLALLCVCVKSNCGDHNTLDFAYRLQPGFKCNSHSINACDCTVLCLEWTRKKFLFYCLQNHQNWSDIAILFNMNWKQKSKKIEFLSNSNERVPLNIRIDFQIQSNS